MHAFPSRWFYSSEDREGGREKHGSSRVAGTLSANGVFVCVLSLYFYIHLFLRVSAARSFDIHLAFLQTRPFNSFLSLTYTTSTYHPTVHSCIRATTATTAISNTSIHSLQNVHHHPARVQARAGYPILRVGQTREIVSCRSACREVYSGV